MASRCTGLLDWKFLDKDGSNRAALREMDDDTRHEFLEDLANFRDSNGESFGGRTWSVYRTFATFVLDLQDVEREADRTIGATRRAKVGTRLLLERIAKG